MRRAQRTWTLLKLMTLLLSLSCQGSEPDGSIIQLRSAYGSGATEAGDRMGEELLTQTKYDPVRIQEIQTIAREYARAPLLRKASQALDRIVGQKKAVAVVLQLINSREYRAVLEYLQQEEAKTLPREIYLYLKAHAACRLRKHQLCAETLDQLTKLDFIPPSLSVLLEELRIRHAWHSGSKQRAETLLTAAARRYPRESVFKTLPGQFEREVPPEQLNTAHVTGKADSEPFEAIDSPCIGRQIFSGIEVWGALSVCEEGAAIVGSQRSDRLLAYCCPLPYGDVLESDVLESTPIYQEHHCPPQHVVTAALPRCPLAVNIYNYFHNYGSPCAHALECSPINKKKYRLMKSTSATHWGEGSTLWLQPRSSPTAKIPWGVRQAFGRVTRFLWDIQGCAGVPIGSLLVAKEGKDCHHSRYSELQFKEKGRQSVPVVPACTGRVDPFNVRQDCGAD